MRIAHINAIWKFDGEVSVLPRELILAANAAPHLTSVASKEQGWFIDREPLPTPAVDYIH